MKDLSQLNDEELQAELERRRKEKERIEKAQKKDYEMHKNNFIRNTAKRFEFLNGELKDLKEEVIIEANKLYNRMYEMAGKEPKETKSFSLKSEDGSMKLTVDRQERFEFTEEANVHIDTIKKVFRDKFESRHKGFYNILNSLLIKGGKGEYDPKLLAKARKDVRELGDAQLIEEFDKLDECQRVIGSSLYARFYVKDDHGRWQDLSLNFSSL